MTQFRQSHYLDIDQSAGGQYPLVSGEVWHSDDGRYMFKLDGVWHVSDFLGPRVYIDDSDDAIGTNQVLGFWWMYNSFRYWKQEGDTERWLWRDSGQWAISSELGMCTAEEWIQATARVIYRQEDDIDYWDLFGSLGLPDSSEAFIDTYESSEDAIEARDAWIIANSYYAGDEWWSCSTFEGVYLPRGSLRGDCKDAYCGPRKFVSWGFVGHKQVVSGIDGPSGEYAEYERAQTFTLVAGETPEGCENCDQDEWTLEPSETDLSEAGSDVDENVLIGIGVWKDGSGKEYRQSYRGTYGDIYNDGYGWVIGQRDSEDGWYEGSEPSKVSPVTFTRKKTATGEYPGITNLVITYFKQWTGDEKKDVYVGEVGLWL
jgi:hypothetical protein